MLYKPNLLMSFPTSQAPVRVMCSDWPPPTDVSQLPAAAFLLSTLWEPGQNITIDFIDNYAAPWKKAWVQKVVTEMVQPYVNLNLQFVNYGHDADIRITFAHDNQAYSRLGTQSTWYKGSSQQPESMNLGWLDEPHSGSFEWEGVMYTLPGCTWCSANQNGSVIIHEFGHALGMVHEHQNPEGGIDWNIPAVLSYFGGAPNYWSDDQIYFNVIDKYDATLLNASKFDPQSIMLYAFPASLTNDGTATRANAIMSPTDIEWMARVYGTPGEVDEPVMVPGEVDADMEDVVPGMETVYGEDLVELVVAKTPMVVTAVIAGVALVVMTTTLIMSSRRRGGVA